MLWITWSFCGLGGRGGGGVFALEMLLEGRERRRSVSGLERRSGIFFFGFGGWVWGCFGGCRGGGGWDGGGWDCCGGGGGDRCWYDGGIALLGSGLGFNGEGIYRVGNDDDDGPAKGSCPCWEVVGNGGSGGPPPPTPLAVGNLICSGGGGGSAGGVEAG